MIEPLTQWITLDSGLQVRIPKKFDYSKCKFCKCGEIIWGTTAELKPIPVEFDERLGWVNHLAYCKNK